MVVYFELKHREFYVLVTLNEECITRRSCHQYFLTSPLEMWWFNLSYRNYGLIKQQRTFFRVCIASCKHVKHKRSWENSKQ